MRVVPEKRIAALAVVNGTPRTTGRSPPVVVILKNHRGSAAPLLATIGSWKINPVNVAHPHCSSASHCSISVQASSLALSH